MIRAEMPSSQSQRGGITIMVALLLLVLLTVAAVGMSRNSFREVVISGTSRQGAMVRNAADSGVEWAILWLQGDPTNATATATGLQALKVALIADTTQGGKPFDPRSGAAMTPYAGPWSSAAADLSLPVTGPSGTNAWTSVALIGMGKLPIQDTGQGVSQGSFRPGTGAIAVQAPDLWAVRSDAQVQVGTGALAPTFIHSKEVWISTAAGVR